MKKKLLYLFFFLCLIKLYDIADRSLNFSTDLLQKSFKHGSGEKNSFISAADDFIPIKNFFTNKSITNFKLSKEILKKENIVAYMTMIEFNYPIKAKQSSSILVAFNYESNQDNCSILLPTKNYNIYECK